MAVRLRTLVALGALAGAAGVVLLDKPARPPEAAAVNPDRAAAGRPASAESLQVPARRGLERARGELFGAPPSPPQSPAVATAAAGASVAPPVPYRFAGKLRKGSEEEVLVSKGELVFPIKVGDTLDGTYRVESIGAEHIELLYLPLGTRERIAVSSALHAEPAAAPVAAGAPAQPAAFRTAIR